MISKAAVCLLGLIPLFSSTYSSSVVLSRGACPNPSQQPNFDIRKFLGTWYEYETFDRSPTVCVSATYSDNGNGTIGVLNEGYLLVKRFGMVTQRTRIHVPGIAYAPDSHKPAELRLAFRGDGDTSQEPNYIILNTDYTNYAVVFSCAQVPGRNLNLQGAWILTRARGVAPPNLDKIKQSLTASGIYVKSFVVSVHKDCQPGEKHEAPGRGLSVSAGRDTVPGTF